MPLHSFSIFENVCDCTPWDCPHWESSRTGLFVRIAQNTHMYVYVLILQQQKQKKRDIVEKTIKSQLL